MTVRIVPLLFLAAAAGCALSTTDSAVEVGTVHVIAFDDDGRPASGADVIVHDADGQLVGRAKLYADGTGDVKSVAGATVSVAIRAPKKSTNVIVEGGAITSFASVPLDATLHVGVENEANGAPVDIAMELPPITPPVRAYFIEIGCGDTLVAHTGSPVFHVPAGCVARKHSIVAYTLTDRFDDRSSTVLRGVDLQQAGTIHMPELQPLSPVNLDVTSHDPHSTSFDGAVRQIDRGTRVEFFGAQDRHTGHITSFVSAGGLDFTDYHVDVRFNLTRDVAWSYYDRVEPGAPAPTTTVDERTDLLAPPRRAPGTNDQVSFVFDGNPDYRELDIRYGCLKCAAQAHWKFFAPPGPDPIALPEMPDDLKHLTPQGGFIEVSIGRIFDASELDGYAAWLATDPAQVSVGIHRESLVVLAAGPQD